MVSQNDRIGLVTPPGREEEALERLGRIGYTNVSAPTSHLIQSRVWHHFSDAIYNRTLDLGRNAVPPFDSWPTY